MGGSSEHGAMSWLRRDFRVRTGRCHLNSLFLTFLINCGLIFKLNYSSLKQQTPSSSSLFRSPVPSKAQLLCLKCRQVARSRLWHTWPFPRRLRDLQGSVGRHRTNFRGSGTPSLIFHQVDIGHALSLT